MSRAHVHRMGVKLYVTPLNYDGIIEVKNIIDGSVINFCDAPRFKVKHTYLTANRRLADRGVYLEAATRDNNLHIGVGSYLEAVKNGENVIKTTQFGAFGEQAVEFNDFDAVQGETVEVTKYVSIYTGRDIPGEEIPEAVAEEISAFRMLGFEKEFKEHQAVYARLWLEADIQIRGDFELDRAVRFNIFHLMSTGNFLLMQMKLVCLLQELRNREESRQLDAEGSLPVHWMTGSVRTPRRLKQEMFSLAEARCCVTVRS